MEFNGNRRGIVFIGLLIVAATLAVYWPVRHYDFVDYDDDSYVFENPDVTHGLSWGGVKWAFVDRHSSNWHPITWLSHMADCQWFGLNAGPAHLENVILHGASALLLLVLLAAITGAPWRSALVAALFALHPLRVESVAWISERKDVLSGLFFMLTLWCYVLHARKQAEDETGTNRSSLFYSSSLVFFTLGLLSKPTLVTVPVVLLLLDYWPLRRFYLSSLPRLLIEKLPFFLLSIAIGVITLWAQNGTGWVNTGDSTSDRLQNVVINYFRYIEKLLWPQDLSFLYPRTAHSPADFYFALTVLLGISAAALILVRRRPWFIVGWLWFLVMLLPVCGWFELGRQSIADRYTYLPGIGFAIVVTWSVAELGGGLSLPGLRYTVNTIVALIVLAGCVVLTWRQVGYWQNTQTLMEHSLEVDPGNVVARQNLHIYLLEKKHPELKSKSTAHPK
ncbi:MAG TPA: hypothetical protein VN625_00355 [Desulfuromonadaceae bacterium]|nr:hypothetical protein [Desulfuromonadaceae bacterium]